jgi:putative salt-induced outer membrane protein
VRLAPAPSNEINNAFLENNMTKNILAAALLSAVAMSAQADGWSGAGELGLVVSSGNTDTSTVNAKLGLKKEDQAWLYEGSIQALRAEGSDEVTAERWEVAAKAGYKVNDRSYIYGSYRHEDDNFAPFERQTIIAVGYGRQIIKNEATQLSFEAGPGYKWVDPQSWEFDSQGELVVRGNMDFKHAFNENVSLYDTLLLESGSDNTFLQNDIGVQVKMTESLALKTGVLVRHNTDVVAPTKKTDTLTTLNLVYGF